jgi:carbamoyl-phosphate synthase small subunit
LASRGGQKIPTLQSSYLGYNARLMLEDNSLFQGIGFGYPCDLAGEVVFNTGMVGYTEALSDPSYRGQILCMTYPLIGNYGVPSKEIKDEYGLPKYFESENIQVKGLIIYELSDVASHWSCIKTIDQWLYDEEVPGICGVDTRELTKKLRVNGSMRGVLSVSKDDVLDKAKASKMMKSRRYGTYEGWNFLSEVSVTEPREYGDKNRDCIVLLDTGTKYSIIRNIIRIGYRVVCLPWDTGYQKIKAYKPKGVVISNGPGDPKVCKSTIETAVQLIDTATPTLGICLGNQILALAGGADTYKLKFGHRGQNKPCISLRNNHAFITSQNHGYGIDAKSLDKTDFETWFLNADDNTVEGIQHKTKPIIAVQFHPEASPGPYDCLFVFDEFKAIIDKYYKSNDSKEQQVVSNPSSIGSSMQKNLNRKKRRKIAKT